MNREESDDLMNKCISDLEFLVDNFFNTCEADALAAATVSPEELAKELIGIPEEPASAIRTGPSTGHEPRKCIHRSRNISNSQSRERQIRKGSPSGVRPTEV